LTGGSGRRTGRLVLAVVAVLVVLGGTAGTVAVLANGRGAPPSAATATTGSSPVAGGPEGAAAGLPGSPASLSASPFAAASRSASVSPSANPAKASPSALAGGPGPIAADEFTGTEPDPSRWGIYESTAPNGSMWTPAMVRVTGGELQIVGQGRNQTGKGNMSGGLCWCSPGGNQIFGIWQVRARFDVGTGYGPIIGLWPKSNSSTEGAITFANAPLPDRKKLRGYVSWTANGRQAFEHTLAGDYTSWHTFTVEWRATFVKMFVDGKMFYDTTTSPTPVVIPQVPMHLYIQQLVGPVDDVPGANTSTPDQVVAHVDWARIYR
jgi:hypothetical protein